MATQAPQPLQAPNTVYTNGKISMEGGVTVHRHFYTEGETYRNRCFHRSTLVDCKLVNCKVFHCQLHNCILQNVSLFESLGTWITRPKFNSKCTMSRAQIDLVRRLDSLDDFRRQKLLHFFFRHTLGPESKTALLFKRTPPLLAALRVGNQRLYKEALLAYYRLSVFVLDSTSVSTCAWLSTKALKYIHTLMIVYVLSLFLIVAEILIMQQVLESRKVPYTVTFGWSWQPPMYRSTNSAMVEIY
jgi:hypothetical protein